MSDLNSFHWHTGTDNASPVRSQIKDFEVNGSLDRKEVNAPLPITRGTKDRPYTDEEVDFV